MGIDVQQGQIGMGLLVEFEKGQGHRVLAAKCQDEVLGCVEPLKVFAHGLVQSFGTAGRWMDHGERGEVGQIGQIKIQFRVVGFNLHAGPEQRLRTQARARAVADRAFVRDGQHVNITPLPWAEVKKFVMHGCLLQTGWDARRA